MNIRDCNLNVTYAVSSPLIIESAEPKWVKSRDSGCIPDALFRLYSKANFFSLFEAPSYFRDEKNILFSYLGYICDGIRSNFDSAAIALNEIVEVSNNIYSPLKKARGDYFDLEAGDKQMRAFKLLIIDLYACHDLFSEIVASFFTGKIPDLKVGKAQFSKIFSYLQTQAITRDETDLPLDQMFGLVSESLQKNYICSGSSEKWFDIFRMFRHKLAHLGTSVFKMVMLHDNEYEFFGFLPNQWPYIPEEHITVSGEKRLVGGDISEYFTSNFIHQDIVSYSKSLFNRTKESLGDSFDVMCKYYELLSELPLNAVALQQLLNSREHFSFKSF